MINIQYEALQYWTRTKTTKRSFLCPM